MDIYSVTRDYAQCISNGAITEPTGGTWVSAAAIYLGQTSPVNNSWLQALCVANGVTTPVYGSWVIALADGLGITQPLNGSWWYAIADEACNGAPPVPTDLIWNLTDTNWELEEEAWKTVAVPDAPLVVNQSFTDDSTPTIVGTATAGFNVKITIDGNSYTGPVDEFGDWAIEVTNGLSGVASPGTDYPLEAVTVEPIYGVESLPTNVTITIISNTVTLTLNMYDSYGDGWNYGYFQLEQETSPGVWTPIEYNENPFRFSTGTQLINFKGSGDMTGAEYYKTDSILGIVSGTTGLRFERYEPYVEPAWTNTPPGNNDYKDCVGLRTWTVPPSGNFRTVSVTPGNYTTERSYEIFNGATQIVAVPTSAPWAPGAVQSTFTL